MYTSSKVLNCSFHYFHIETTVLCLSSLYLTISVILTEHSNFLKRRKCTFTTHPLLNKFTFGFCFTYQLVKSIYWIAIGKGYTLVNFETSLLKATEKHRLRFWYINRPVSILQFGKNSNSYNSSTILYTPSLPRWCFLAKIL